MLFQFKLPDGGPADGASVVLGPDIFAVADHVRCLDADRATLLTVGTKATGPSGLALIWYEGMSLPVSATTSTGTGGWPSTYVAFSDGWVFLEDEREVAGAAGSLRRTAASDRRLLFIYARLRATVPAPG